MGDVIGEKEKLNGFESLISYNANETFADEKENCERFRLIYIENGSCIIILNEDKVSIAAPAILCMNENEYPKLEYSFDISAKSISFHPGNINSKFNFYNIREKQNNFSYTDFQDSYLLTAWLERNHNFSGIINLDFETANYIAKLFECVNKELILQRDMFWPCRSRSFLLEILVLTTRLFDKNNYVSDNKEANEPQIVEDIITYLCDNYQNKITLNSLALTFNTNRTTLSKQFYEAKNISIINYLIKHRINIAATLLRDTLLPISEIKEKVGFNDDANFWRMFKKYVGLSPSMYRSKYCWVE
ncbi:helix-turn-helix domain-containing protein [Inconstantimicrobium mannanitabidum]|uniref:Uncharacterized protein n=1 Tax=Inconstantimicrobium mannanitabidum TaxID=1604901 RepID=A0ACB5RHM0_9CLOT|nr:AraC family transcriptional regulator [Clostridium sp. TW13]GKX68577.1 hypothetical protein rsdtw13_38350 [Clostridium sp. TW13]